MKQINDNGVLIYISDEEYDRRTRFQIVDEIVEERGSKDEVQNKIKSKTSKTEKANRKSRNDSKRKE